MATTTRATARATSRRRFTLAPPAGLVALPDTFTVRRKDLVAPLRFSAAASDLPISAWDTCLSLSSSYVSCSFCCDRRGRVGLGRRPRRPPGRRAKPIPHQYIYPRVNGVLPLSLSIADFGAPESTRCLHAAISMVGDAFDLPSRTHFVSSSDSDRSKETSVG